MKALIAYATTDGHTRIIARRIAEWIENGGAAAELVDTAAIPANFDVHDCDAYIIAGSVHAGKHQSSLVHFVKRNLKALEEKPSMFLSASLCCVIKDEEHAKEAEHCIGTFLDDTAWKPTVTHPVEGALLYTQYDWLKRFMMKMISKSQGGTVDTSQDYEYTDWPALQKAVTDFMTANTATAASPR